MTNEEKRQCPKCGEPPRRMVITALVSVSVDLYNQGVPKRGTSCTLIKRVGGAPMFSCGGGHTWSAENDEEAE